MITLGIETSCDETAVAVVENGKKVLSSLISSQTKIHEKFGGIVPEIASREHLIAIHPLFQEALKQAQIEKSAIDLVAVTQGPGLIGSLLVGVAFAKGLSHARGLPLVPVNHVHAHVHGALLNVREPASLFPALALVVSGGHTNLYWAASATRFRLLSFTTDDACGEAFDKVAKALGLPYPGGPEVEKLARQGNSAKFPMPQMMKHSSDLNFSYSGLKTHVMYALKKNLAPQQIPDLCAAFQDEAFSQLTRKLKMAWRNFSEAKSVIIAGGVSANVRFQQMMRENFSLPVVYPELRFCSDNAAMIASLGHDLYCSEGEREKFSESSWEAFSRYDFHPV